KGYFGLYEGTRGDQVIVYHGSSVAVPSPDIYHSRDNVDFGKGFYLTPIKQQAEKWASRFKLRKECGIVSVYEFDFDTCRKNFSVMEFEGYTEEWLDFIVSCRNVADKSAYDIVAGGVANDRVFNTIELYFEGLIEKQEAIKRLRYMEPNRQICIRRQEIIERYLCFVEREVI
ncbi:MAG: DUF3990 domain-containing protein, partial [Alistipes sp.]|nr:DUF3990 domain-containing protein [Alistipes sp.]